MTGHSNDHIIIQVIKLLLNVWSSDVTEEQLVLSEESCIIKPMETLLKVPKYVNNIAKLGNTWDIPEHIFDELMQFF